MFKPKRTDFSVKEGRMTQCSHNLLDIIFHTRENASYIQNPRVGALRLIFHTILRFTSKISTDCPFHIIEPFRICVKAYCWFFWSTSSCTNALWLPYHLSGLSFVCIVLLCDLLQSSLLSLFEKKEFCIPSFDTLCVFARIYSAPLMIWEEHHDWIRVDRQKESEAGMYSTRLGARGLNSDSKLFIFNV